MEPAQSQTMMEVQLNPTLYNGAYHIRCNGGHDGEINTVLLGGEEPFSFLWSNGATTEDVDQLTAGAYTVTVTQNGGGTATASVLLREPSVLDPSLYSPSYAGGTNISINGGNDGSIQLTGQGGTPPYEYLWSNSSQEQDLYDLMAGTYTVTVTDANACTQTRSITLTEPAPLSIVSITSPDYNGYNLSCAGGSDGSINLTVTGGVAPYDFLWNNGSFDEDPTGLTAGEYAIRVMDQNGTQAEASITLTQPDALSLELSPFVYPNNYHISLYGGYDGSIVTTAGGGVTPYNFLWNDGNTLQNRTTLNHGNKSLTLTDANGCELNAELLLLEPASADWMMDGNENTDPATQFIGTKDSTDLVFRTDNTERLRITSGGTAKVNGNLQLDNGSNDSIRVLYLDGQGLVKIIPGGGTPGCIGLTNHWFTDYCTNTNDIFNLPATGNVGIGTSFPQEKLHVHGNAVFMADPPQVSTGNTSPMIRGSVTHSAAVKPDYTWKGDDQTGIFHPSDNVIGFTSNGSESMRINASGAVGIGTTYIPSAFRLAVDGYVIATDITVKLRSNWPDYVFREDYPLRSPDDLKQFIQDNRHLPGMPAAEEIRKGLNQLTLGDLQVRTIEKTEENTLYILQLNEKINQLQKEMNLLKDEIKILNRKSP